MKNSADLLTPRNLAFQTKTATVASCEEDAPISKATLSGCDLEFASGDAHCHWRTPVLRI